MDIQYESLLTFCVWYEKECYFGVTLWSGLEIGLVLSSQEYIALKLLAVCKSALIESSKIIAINFPPLIGNLVN